MSSPTHKILIVGATGQQGTAVLSALSTKISSLSFPSSTLPSFKFLALTRSPPDSPKAKDLVARYPGLDIEVVQGDTREPDPIFEAHPDIGAVFSYTLPPDEQPQATRLIDRFFGSSSSSSSSSSSAATAPRVEEEKRFVFSSVDRGGDVKSWETPTEIPHFAQKHDIELHLRSAVSSSSRKTYTILRPVAFMDNLNPSSPFGKVFAAIWWTLSPADKRLQLVSVRDIGLVAAEALLDPFVPSASGEEEKDNNNNKFRNKAVGLAGDSLTYLEARAVFRRVSGGKSELPQTFGVVGYGIRWMVREVGSMFRWFETDGYGVDVDALRRDVEPRMQDLETWLRESSKFDFGKK